MGEYEEACRRFALMKALERERLISSFECVEEVREIWYFVTQHTDEPYVLNTTSLSDALDRWRLLVEAERFRDV